MAARKKRAAKAKSASKPKAAPRAAKLATPASRIVSGLTKKFGANKAILVSDELKAISQVKERIPTGVDVIDHYVLGNGGLPVGRASEWFGPNGIGKTSLAMCMLGSAQRAGGVATYVDVEQSFDEARAVTFGVNMDELILIQPYSLEELLEEIKETVRLHNVDDGPMLIMWDSIAAAITETGHKKTAGTRKVGDVPQILSEELKKITAMLPKKRTHLAYLNQVRDNIGVMFGDKTTTPGGHAPKYYASQRVQLLGGKAVKNARKEHVAKVVTAIAVKNRLGPPWRKARVRLDYNEVGFNNVWSTSFFAKQQGLISPREKGFSGPNKEGLATYLEAIEALGWPDPAYMPKPVTSAIVAADDGEEEPKDADADDSEE